MYVYVCMYMYVLSHTIQLCSCMWYTVDMFKCAHVLRALYSVALETTFMYMTLTESRDSNQV